MIGLTFVEDHDYVDDLSPPVSLAVENVGIEKLDEGVAVLSYDPGLRMVGGGVSIVAGQSSEDEEFLGGFQEVVGENVIWRGGLEEPSLSVEMSVAAWQSLFQQPPVGMFREATEEVVYGLLHEASHEIAVREVDDSYWKHLLRTLLIAEITLVVCSIALGFVITDLFLFIRGIGGYYIHPLLSILLIFAAVGMIVVSMISRRITLRYMREVVSG